MRDKFSTTAITLTETTMELTNAAKNNFNKFSAAAIIFTGFALQLTDNCLKASDVIFRAFSPLTEMSNILSQVQDILDKSDDYHKIDPDFQDLDTLLDIERELRKQKSERRLKDQPRTSRKK
jgi:hypothetical protein